MSQPANVHIAPFQNDDGLQPAADGPVQAYLNIAQLSVVLVGGGAAAARMLQLLLAAAPGATPTVVAAQPGALLAQVVQAARGVKMFQKPFEETDLLGADAVVITVKEPKKQQAIYTAAKEKGLLVCVDGAPNLSDFYLAPATSKKPYRAGVNHLPASPTHNAEAYWRRIATYCLFAFFFMFLGHFILSFVPYKEVWKSMLEVDMGVDNRFYWMIAAGFLAQLVDGALGMGYGVTCTTVLLSMGVNLPAISSSIHTAEMFSSGMSGYTHYKFGNVNKKLFKALLIPGIIGAIGGAILLSKFGESNAGLIRPLLAAYTLVLGLRILLSALRKKQKAKKVKRVGWLAGIGGFLDSFGGGGWGPLVTSTLISKGRTPKYVIGSVSITEFFVTLASTITFFTFLGVSHWQIIAGLIIGGMLAAPLAARLVGKLPVKTMLIAVGLMVVLWSLHILVRSLFF